MKKRAAVYSHVLLLRPLNVKSGLILRPPTFDPK